MSARGFILLFLILLLTLTPVSANEETLDINIEFPGFYEITTGCKCVGVVGHNYTANVIIRAQNKEVNLTNKILEIKCDYREREKLSPDEHIYIYKGLDSVWIDDSFNLSEELNTTLLGEEENVSFPIYIYFYETGLHEMRWKEKEESKWYVSYISIVPPIEWENLIKQAELIEAEKLSAEKSGKIADETKRLANITLFAALVALIIPFLVALAIFYLQSLKRTIRIINAFYNEIKHNHSLAQQIIKGTQPDDKLLDAGSYQNMRLTGELLARSKRIQEEIDEFYILIDNHNSRRFSTKKEIHENLEKISKKAEYLEDELPKDYPRIRKFLL
jgi:hypothetical protein